MGDVPPDLGNSLLVIMSNTPGSLAMVKIAARQLPDPTHVEITLAHYLEPVLWQDHVAAQALEKLFRQEELLLDGEQASQSDVYFQQSRSLLRDIGIPISRIHVEAVWNQRDIASVRLAKLADGTYSTLIIARHHYDLLHRLLDATLADVLRRNGSRAMLWVIDS
jgi:hypothetical protein